jgi:hypothetical protein
VKDKNYTNNVFINCPFDDQYMKLRDAIIFAIFDCGFIPRCALEENNGVDVRFDKIKRLISESKYGVHDISRTEVDQGSNLPRFNMPLELGVFIGAARYGDQNQKNKSILILDKKQHRYQAFISDIAGQDIRSHDDDPKTLIKHVRDWLSINSRRTSIPGGADINARYSAFKKVLPKICKAAKLKRNEITYNDLCNFISLWLTENPR